MAAPINQIPAEILALIPDFWDIHKRDRYIIALTHVCRDWRDAFISQPSLWTNLDCVDADKTRTYIERSKSSPINLSLRRENDISSNDPFFLVTPPTIRRLKSLSVEFDVGDLGGIISHLSHRAPLLEDVILSGNHGFGDGRHEGPLPLSALFKGDMSTLRKLCLRFIDTDLPWKNMACLTSFKLFKVSVPTRNLLDFFEGAPRLREVVLDCSTQASGDRDGRLVSMTCLKKMNIVGSTPARLLLNHLSIPVGVKLTTQSAGHTFRAVDHLPRSLDNLMNFPGFTTIRLLIGKRWPTVKFSGPNGKVCMTTKIHTGQCDTTDSLLESLSQFDTSKAERLKLDSCHFKPSGPPKVLLLVDGLRKIRFNRCQGLRFFIDALDPGLSPSGVVVCPKLEELVLIPSSDPKGFVHPLVTETSDFRRIIGMVASRASRGAKLTTVKIVGMHCGRQLDPAEVSELRKYVWNVEYDDGGQ